MNVFNVNGDTYKLAEELVFKKYTDNNQQWKVFAIQEDRLSLRKSYCDTGILNQFVKDVESEVDKIEKEYLKNNVKPPTKYSKNKKNDEKLVEVVSPEVPSPHGIDLGWD